MTADTQPLTCARHTHKTTSPISSPSTTSATVMPFTSEEKCHNGFNQPRPKRRVHPPPEAFLSLIRRASSCLQTQNLLAAMMAGLLTNTDSKSKKIISSHSRQQISTFSSTQVQNLALIWDDVRLARIWFMQSCSEGSIFFPTISDSCESN